jgi:hypothetical protein
MKLDCHIAEFLKTIGTRETEIYNEISLQLELGLFLRKHIKNSKVQFERNISYFDFKSESAFEKKEIDIAITSNASNQLLSAIELKFPRNGQVPESMFSFCKDIAFLEQLVSAGFQSGYFLAVVDSHLFYSKLISCENIYGLFRGDMPIEGTIIKPTGAKDKKVTLQYSYRAKWFPVSDDKKYCLIQIYPQTSQPRSNAGKDTNN